MIHTCICSGKNCSRKTHTENVCTNSTLLMIYFFWIETHLYVNQDFDVHLLSY
jgi:hypothetical protein